MAESTAMIQVEVAFATPQKQQIVSLEVPEGTTATEAVRQSAIAKDFPDFDFNAAPMGIFGKKLAQPETEVLQAGDRVEVYRPLLIDPKQARLNRAAKARESN